MCSILLVDDNAELVEFASIALRRALPGFPIRIAYSCREARDILSTLAPDLVVLDEHLPDGTGDDLMDDLERLSPASRVILIGGRVSERSGSSSARSPDAVLEKPFSVRELVWKCERFLRAPENRPDEGGVAVRPHPEPGSGPGSRHYLVNRLAGLLAGLQAFGAELSAEAGNEIAVHILVNEYVPILSAMVKEVSGLLTAQPQPKALEADRRDELSPAHPRR